MTLNLNAILLAVGMQGFAATVSAQGMPAGCTGLVTIQSQGCTVRQVFTCETDAEGTRWVVTHGPNGPLSLSVLDKDSTPLRVSTGPNAPSANLGAVANPVDLASVLAGTVDEFEYQLDFEDGKSLRVSGAIVKTGRVVEIDGRALQELQRVEVTRRPDNSLSPETDNRMLYDAELGLALNATTTDRATGEQKSDRTPVDFILSGEDGFTAFLPIYGCEE